MRLRFSGEAQPKMEVDGQDADASVYEFGFPHYNAPR
jgi:hypothetical protein